MNLHWSFRWKPTTGALMLLGCVGCDSTAVVTIVTPCDAGLSLEAPCPSAPGEPSGAADDPAEACEGPDCNDRPGCGDSELDEGEECDDGNREAGDGCDEACLLELEPCAASPANAVLNAAFDHDIDGWGALDDSSVSGQLDSRSAGGPASSGSLAVTLDVELEAEGPVLRTSAGAIQCVEVEPADYELSAYYFIEGGAPESTAASLAVVYNAGRDCTGEVLARWTSLERTARGEWGIIAEPLATPPGTRSASLRLSVSKNFDDRAATVLFDEVALVPEAEASECGLDEREAPDSSEPTTPESPDDASAPEPEPTEAEAEPEPSAPEPEPTEVEPEPSEVEPEPEPSEVEPEPPVISYSQAIEPIFVATCVVSCHQPGGLGGPGGPLPNSQLDLSAGVGYDELTTLSSLQLTSLSLVGATVDESYLWLKLIGSPDAQGDPMPSVGDPLGSDQLALVREWIESGANP